MLLTFSSSLVPRVNTDGRFTLQCCVPHRTSSRCSWTAISKYVCITDIIEQGELTRRCQEATTRQVELKDDCPTIVARCIIGLYHQNYPVSSQTAVLIGDGKPYTAPTLEDMFHGHDVAAFNFATKKANPEQSVSTHWAMLLISDRLLIHALKQLAMTNLEEMVLYSPSVFWTVKDHVESTEIDCQPLIDALGRLAVRHIDILGKDDRFEFLS